MGFTKTIGDVPLEWSGKGEISTLPGVPEREFAFSRWGRRQRRLLPVVVPFVFVSSFGFSLVLARGDVAESLWLGGRTFATAVFIIAVVLPISARLSRTQRILFFEDRLIRESGRIREPVRWEEITHVERIEDAEGSVVTLRLRGMGRGRIDLSGFEEMDVLDRLVRTKIAPSASYQTRHLHPYWKYFFGAVVGGAGLMALFSMLLLSGVLLDVLPLLTAPFGPYLLFGRPMTRYDPRLKWFEVVFGVYFMFTSVFLGYLAYRVRFG